MRDRGFTVFFWLFLLATVPARAATWSVPDSGNSATNGVTLQNVLNSSVRLGDTVLLTPGATYFSSSGFTFTDKGSGTGTSTDYITIQPADMTRCPASGTRIDPSIHAAGMPKLISSGPPAIAVNARAHHWRFICLEVTNDQLNYSPALIYTGTNGTGFGGGPTYNEVFATHDITFDRLFVHNPEVTPNNLHPQALSISAGRGIGLIGVNLSVLNSWIGSFAGSNAV